MFKRLTDGYFALGIIVGGLFAIFCLVWIIGLNYCPNQPCKYSEAADHPSDNGSQGIWNVPDAMRGTFSYNSEPEYAEGNPQRHEYYDLRAQERMAHATDWIAWLTAATGFFSALGLGAIIYTLNLQRTSNQILLDDQRGWVKQSGFNTDFDATKSLIGMGFTALGRAPITNVRTNVIWRVERHGSDFIPFFEPMRDQDLSPPGVNFPNEEFLVPERNISPADLIRASEGKVFLYAHFRVQYDTNGLIGREYEGVVCYLPKIREIDGKTTVFHRTGMVKSDHEKIT